MLRMKLRNISQIKPLVFQFIFSALFIYGHLGCTTLQPKPSFEVGQIYDVSDQTLLTVDDLIPHLLAADVIFLGEEHYTPSHIEAAITVLDMLRKHQRLPGLAMEMLSWDGQAGLDRYINKPEMTVAEFLEESRWKENWGGDFPDYQPLVDYARTYHLPLLGLNPPRSLVRLVATKGLTEALRASDFASWTMTEGVTNNPEYESLIFEQITACHPKLPDHVYRRIFEASIIRDEGMATIIRNFLDKRPTPQTPLVSYTGGGHIQYDVPVPKRVKRTHPAIKTVTIYLVAWDPSKNEEILAELHEGIADYVWLTPLGPNGLQPRCG
ncbi:MAG: ChaN family lipoprotein [Nitrospirota bacterium]|nr:ChaN family lipoprotein [Nitrospirota bacterium]